MRALILALLIPLTVTVAADPCSRGQYRFTLRIRGIVGFVQQPDKSLLLLFPDLSDPGLFLDGRMVDVGADQVVSHQLRIFIKGAVLLQSHRNLPISHGYLCHAQSAPDPLPMVNVTELDPYEDWKFILSENSGPIAMVARDNEVVGLHLPKIREYVSQIDKRKLHSDLLDDSWDTIDRQLLVARLDLGDIRRSDLVTEFFGQDCKLAGEKLRMPSAVRWETCLSSPIHLCDSIEQCIEASARLGEALEIVVDNNPPKRVGEPCNGGTHDFWAHFNILKEPKKFFRHPVPICRIRKGRGENPQCSPAEQGGP